MQTLISVKFKTLTIGERSWRIIIFNLTSKENSRVKQICIILIIFILLSSNEKWGTNRYCQKYFILPASLQSSSTICRTRLRPADDLNTAQWRSLYTLSLLKELQHSLYKSVDELTASQLCLLSNEAKQT